MLQKRLILKTSLLLGSCLPLLLFAYLGAHSRLIHDDFGVSAMGLKYGAWDGLIRYYNRWTSAYSTIYLRLSLADYAVALPPLFTALIITVGLLGLYALLGQWFACYRLDGLRRVIALGTSCLALAAAINAFYTPESFYWYSASVQYTLPLVCLIVCLALATWSLRVADNRGRLIWGAGACALISFLTAGASEMFLVFQATCLTLFAALAFVISAPHHRRALIIVAGSMLIATTIGLIVQLSSPGIWNRMESDASNYSQPIRSISQLAIVTVQITFESIGRQEVIAGFTLLAAAGLFIGLQTKPSAQSRELGLSANNFAYAVAIGLAIQLVFLPVLLAQQSNTPQFFERYSTGFVFVICLNLALILSLLLVLGQRRRIEAALRDWEHGLTGVSGLLLLAFLLLVTMTQYRSIDARASTYLFVSSLGMLLMLAILWQSGQTDAGIRKLGRAALSALGISWITIAALVFVTFIGHGFTSHRMMAGPAFLQVFAGLLWGLYLGLSIKSLAQAYAFRQRWERLLMAGGIAIAVVIGGGIFLGHARLIPDLQTYAREWDARHADILAQKGSGKSHIEVAPLSFDLAEYIGMGTLSSAEQFYNVESIEIVDA